MEKLFIIAIEDASTRDYEAISVRITKGDPNEAASSYTKMVFNSAATDMIYMRLKRLLARYLADNPKATKWECNLEYSDCPVVMGDAARVAVEPHYRFVKAKNGQRVKATPERIVRFIRVVALGSDVSIADEVEAYKARIPESCRIDYDTADTNGVPF